jgi:filamentous hemagglutinin family protein
MVMTNKKITSLTVFIISLLIYLVGGFPALLYALPQGGKVAAGKADINPVSPDRLNVVQKTDKAIIDWQKFNIGKNEHADFQLPSSSSVNLSRVTGGTRSDILGRLTSNGKLFLINPSGILFGKNARVDVNSLVATTSDIRNEDFLAERYNFNIPSSTPSSIVNRGQINVKEGGMLAFVAPGVENAGLIRARLGQVTLASGNMFTLDLYGDQLINLGVDQKVVQNAIGPNGEKLDSLVNNSGTIMADGGTVVLDVRSARGVVDNVINMSGIIEAKTAVQQNGEIVLMGGDEGIVNVSGTLNASGKGQHETGGTVRVLGNKAGLFGAKIDASGHAGGGEVLIGGDFQGKNPDVPNAYGTYVGNDAAINADALIEGDGGKVIVWSDDVTRVYGPISAHGGLTSGNGGFVETSSKGYLEATMPVDVRSFNGTGGQWLIDPSNIEITGADLNTVNNASVFESNLDGVSTINAATLVAALNVGGATITVNTTTGTATTGNAGTITVSSPINTTTVGAGATLVLDADSTITIDQAIADGGVGLDVTLTTPAGIDINAGITTNGGNFVQTAGATGTILSGATISTGGGNVTFNNGLVTDTGASAINTGAGAGAVTFSDTLTVGTGGLTVTGGSGNVTFTGAAGIGANNLTVASSGITEVTAGGGITGTTGAVDITATTRTDIDETIALSGAGTVTLTGPATISNKNITTVGGDVTFDNALTTDVGAVAIGSGAGAGAVTFSDTLTVGTGGLTVTGGSGNVTFTGAAGIGANNLTVASSGITEVTAGGGITGTTGAVDITATTRTDVDETIALSGAGTVTLTGPATISNKNITTVGGAVTFDNAVILDTGAVSITTAGGIITFRDTLDGTTSEQENLTLNSGAGNIDFDALVGSTTPLGAVTVTSSGAITADFNFTSSSIDQSGVSGTSNLASKWIDASPPPAADTTTTTSTTTGTTTSTTITTTSTTATSTSTTSSPTTTTIKEDTGNTVVPGTGKTVAELSNEKTINKVSDIERAVKINITQPVGGGETSPAQASGALTPLPTTGEYVINVFKRAFSLITVKKGKENTYKGTGVVGNFWETKKPKKQGK